LPIGVVTPKPVKTYLTFDYFFRRLKDNYIIIIG